MHTDRLTKRIFEWDWLKRRNNWSDDLFKIFEKLNLTDIFYNQNCCDVKLVEDRLEGL